MSIIGAIIEYFTKGDVDIISIEEANVYFTNALMKCDKNKNGFLSVKELIKIFKELVDNGGK